MFIPGPGPGPGPVSASSASYAAPVFKKNSTAQELGLNISQNFINHISNMQKTRERYLPVHLETVKKSYENSLATLNVTAFEPQNKAKEYAKKIFNGKPTNLYEMVGGNFKFGHLHKVVNNELNKARDNFVKEMFKNIRDAGCLVASDAVINTHISFFLAHRHNLGANDFGAVEQAVGYAFKSQDPNASLSRMRAEDRISIKVFNAAKDAVAMQQLVRTIATGHDHFRVLSKKPGEY